MVYLLPLPIMDNNNRVCHPKIGENSCMRCFQIGELLISVLQTLIYMFLGDVLNPEISGLG